MRIALILAAIASLHGVAAAQEQVAADPGDSRLQTVMYAPDQVITLQGALGYQLTIELSPDEQVQNIALGDSSGWAATANRKGDHLFVKALAPDAATNMTVITNVRTYYFELISGGGSGSAYSLRFRYPDDRAATDQSNINDGFLPPNVAGNYRIAGDRLVRPASVTTDGRRTYLSWPSDRALPAVFTIDGDGQETVADGMMRNDVMVIDRVVQRLIFRIDQRTARAERIIRSKKR